MAYAEFDNSKPVISDDGAVVIDEIRENLMALRDAIVAGGGPLKDFDLALSGGTAARRTVWTYTHRVSTNIKVRVTVTWGTSGGADGNVTQAVLALSTNGGTNYDTIGTKTWAYDTSGNLTGASWT